MKMFHLSPLAALVILIAPDLHSGITNYIGTSATWKYRDNGTDQGTNWRTTGFDDSAWSSGAAKLGYGGDGEVTSVGFGNATNRYITTYFRRAFTVTNLASLSSAHLRLIRDDGAVVYVNGTEVFRDNLPASAVTYTTLAVNAIGDTNENTWNYAPVNTALLLPGTNVVAVEIHQQSATSSDIGFNLEFTGITDPDLSRGGSQWRYLTNGTNPGTNWHLPGYNDSAWPQNPARFGYGDAGMNTLITNSPVYPTYYFRRKFTVADATRYRTLFLRLLRDDGAIVYLNGTEVARDNMAAGPSTYTNFASAVVDGTDETNFFPFAVNPALLVTGTNTLAVEVHQVSLGSSDIVFDAILTGYTNDGPAVVTRQPYLQLGTPTNVVVRWRTDYPEVGRVRYGTNLADLSLVADESAPVTDHAVTVGPLTPDTRYYYSVGMTNLVRAGGDASYFLTSSPAPGTPKVTRLWVLGDSGSGTSQQTAVRDAYYTLAASENRHINLWLMLGDNAYDNGTDAEYQSTLFDIYGSVLRNSVLWPTIGNHDTANSTTFTNTYPYYRIFTLPTQGEAGGLASGTEAYYSFDYGNIHFICLDSMTADRSTNGAMMTWLRNDLAATAQLWLIAFWHHPPYTKGSHDSDSESVLAEMRERFLPVLEEAGVDLVLSGHSHSYERSKFITGFYATPTTGGSGTFLNTGSGRTNDPLGVYTKSLSEPAAFQGAVYTVAGSSGKLGGGSLNHPVMFVSSNHLASMVIDVDGNRLTARALRENGSLLDSFEIIKQPDVTAVATVTNAAEFGAVPGEITITRTGNTDFSLSVPVTTSGTATPGADYTAPSTNVTLAAGQSSAAVAILPIPDAVAEGLETVHLALASNLAYRVGTPVSAGVNLLDKPMDDWRWLHFGTNANTVPAGDLADADGDGVNNLLEYGLDLDPLVPNADGVPLASLIAPNTPLTIQFPRDPARADLTMRVQASGDLLSWSNVCTSAGSATPTGPGYVSETTNVPHTVTAQDIESPATAPQRFLRLQAERQE